MCALSGGTVAIQKKNPTAVGFVGKGSKVAETQCEGGLEGDFNSLKRFCKFILGSQRKEGRGKEERRGVWFGNDREEKRKKETEEYISEWEKASEAVVFIPQFYHWLPARNGSQLFSLEVSFDSFGWPALTGIGDIHQLYIHCLDSSSTIHQPPVRGL